MACLSCFSELSTLWSYAMKLTMLSSSFSPIIKSTILIWIGKKRERERICSFSRSHNSNRFGLWIQATSIPSKAQLWHDHHQGTRIISWDHWYQLPFAVLVVWQLNAQTTFSYWYSAAEALILETLSKGIIFLWEHQNIFLVTYASSHVNNFFFHLLYCV